MRRSLALLCMLGSTACASLTSPPTIPRSMANARDARGSAPAANHLYVLNASSSYHNKPPSVTTYRLRSRHLVLKITQGITDRPLALAVDGSGDVYVANRNNSVSVYAPGGTTPIRTITSGVDYPFALAIDSSGNLYVANYRGNTVTVYASGSASVLRTIKVGVALPAALAFDSSGNLYVANSSATKGSVTIYAPGATSVLRTITDGVSGTNGNGPKRLAFDSHGNLYVLNSGSNLSSNSYGSVTVYAPGSSTVLRQIKSGIHYPLALALDSSDNLYVAILYQVEVYAPGSTTVLRTITYAGGSTATALAFDAADYLYVAYHFGKRVSVYAPGSASPSLVISKYQGIDTPTALAFGP